MSNIEYSRASQDPRDDYHMRIGVSVLVLLAIGSFVALENTHEGPSPKTEVKSTLTFRSFGDNSNIIPVFPGTSNTLEDETPNHSFLVGQHFQIVCETDGRTMTSDPKNGDQPRTSDEWYKIKSSGKTYFATSTHVSVSGGTPSKC